jgi:hypothetical protein
VRMDLSIAQNAETSAPSVASDYVRSSASPLSRDWVKAAARTARQRKKRAANWPKPFTLTDCLEELIGEPAAQKRLRPVSDAVSAMNAWRDHWETRNSRMAREFFKATEQEEELTQPILKIATDLGNF